MHFLSTLPLLTLASAAALPQTTPATGLWNVNTNDTPRYSAAHAIQNTAYEISFHRYHSNDCNLHTHEINVDHLHSPHCKTFRNGFGSFNFELVHGNLRDRVEELNKCQIAVFGEENCGGDALVLMKGFNKSMGITDGFWCGSTEQFGFGDVGRSVRVMCVKSVGEKLPLGMLKGDFTE